MNSPIKLTNEIPGKFIHFELDPNSPAYEAIYTTTITINPFNDTHRALISQINSFDPTDTNIVDSSVKYIGMVFVKLSEKEPSEILPVEIRGLKYLSDFGGNDPQTDRGVVITVADGSILQLLHKPKRTKGKVSNTLG